MSEVFALDLRSGVFFFHLDGRCSFHLDGLAFGVGVACMLIGIVPVAGIPLPFISYGGSNLVASLLALGVVQSVYARRIKA